MTETTETKIPRRMALAIRAALTPSTRLAKTASYSLELLASDLEEAGPMPAAEEWSIMTERYRGDLPAICDVYFAALDALRTMLGAEGVEVPTTPDGAADWSKLPDLVRNVWRAPAVDGGHLRALMAISEALYPGRKGQPREWSDLAAEALALRESNVRATNALSELGVMLQREGFEANGRPWAELPKLMALMVAGTRAGLGEMRHRHTALERSVTEAEQRANASAATLHTVREALKLKGYAKPDGYAEDLAAAVLAMGDALETARLARKDAERDRNRAEGDTRGQGDILAAVAQALRANNVISQWATPPWSTLPVLVDQLAKDLAHVRALKAQAEKHLADLRKKAPPPVVHLLSSTRTFAECGVWRTNLVESNATDDLDKATCPECFRLLVRRAEANASPAVRIVGDRASTPNGAPIGRLTFAVNADVARGEFVDGSKLKGPAVLVGEVATRGSIMIGHGPTIVAEGTTDDGTRWQVRAEGANPVPRVTRMARLVFSTASGELSAEDDAGGRMLLALVDESALEIRKGLESPLRGTFLAPPSRKLTVRLPRLPLILEGAGLDLVTSPLDLVAVGD